MFLLNKPKLSTTRHSILENKKFSRYGTGSMPILNMVLEVGRQNGPLDPVPTYGPGMENLAQVQVDPKADGDEVGEEKDEAEPGVLNNLQNATGAHPFHQGPF